MFRRRLTFQPMILCTSRSVRHLMLKNVQPPTRQNIKQRTVTNAPHRMKQNVRTPTRQSINRNVAPLTRNHAQQHMKQAMKSSVPLPTNRNVKQQNHHITATVNRNATTYLKNLANKSSIAPPRKAVKKFQKRSATQKQYRYQKKTAQKFRRKLARKFQNKFRCKCPKSIVTKSLKSIARISQSMAK